MPSPAPPAVQRAAERVAERGGGERVTTAVDRGRLIERLRRLVVVDSTNPGAYEHEIATIIVDELRAAAVEVRLVETLPGRHSIAGVIDSGVPGPGFVLNGHMDTVPIGPRSEWSCDPFGGEVRDGRLFGRGACDMKAGLAAQLAVAEALAGHIARGRLILHFAVGEESAEPGTRSLIDAGFGGDLGVVTEPTALRVAVAERGAAFVRVTVHGRGGHGGRPELAENPIDALPRVLQALDEYRVGLAERRHPLLGSPTCSPTVVSAGAIRNTIPSACELVVDRRLIPGESVAGVADAVRRHLAAAPSTSDLRLDVKLDGGGFAPCEVPADGLCARTMCDALAAVTGRREGVIGTAFASDVRNLVLNAGMDAVTFGPGTIDDAHRPNESVALGELVSAAEVLHFAASRLLGRT